MPPINRRHFLSRSAQGAAALAAVAALPPRVLGANDRVVLALLGAGGRGRQLARDFASRVYQRWQSPSSDLAGHP